VNPIPPPADDYPAVIGEVIDAVLAGGEGAGKEALERIAYRRRELPRRPALGRALLGRVFRRDHFTCRYCGAELIPTPIMQLVAELYPDQFPYHPNWKGGETHPAILSRSPVVDHVVPGSAGGDWTDEANLVTACWPCNGRKADFTLEQLGWVLLDVDTDSKWNGLTSRYQDLWRAAGQPKPAYHKGWIAALTTP
jgi:5-methylcytosine-specific restriction endonuclease McrA